MILSKKKKALFEAKSKVFSAYLKATPGSEDEKTLSVYLSHLDIFFYLMGWRESYIKWWSKRNNKMKLNEAVSDNIINGIFDQRTFDFSQAMDDIFKRPVEEKKMPDIGTDKNTWDTSRSKPVIDFMGSLEGKDKEND